MMQSKSSRRQVTLPFSVSVALAYKNIRVRFFRSLVTLLSLVLAVAFLSFVRIGAHLADGLFASTNPHLVRKLESAGFEKKNASTQNQSPGHTKQNWLLFLSFLVCAVGIINAQLMAVTERFREIGTMKCLGALDRFILRLFLLEAGMQGIAGALSGAVIGGVFAFVNMGLTFGFDPLFRYCPWDAVGIAAIQATGIGLFLSIIGVLYPALVAARMRPVAAMRTEY